MGCQKSLINKFSFDDRKKISRKMEGIGKQLYSCMNVNIDLLKNLSLEFLYKNKEYLERVDREYKDVLMKDVMKFNLNEFDCSRKSSLVNNEQNNDKLPSNDIVKERNEKVFEDNMNNDPNNINKSKNTINEQELSLNFIQLSRNLKFEETLSNNLKDLTSIVNPK